MIAIAGPEIVAGGALAPPHSTPSDIANNHERGSGPPGGAMPKRPKRNKRIDAPHVRLYRWLLNSPAYLSLSCPARALLVEIAQGSTTAETTAARAFRSPGFRAMQIARGTAQRAFAELQDRGFIDCMTKGAFSRKSPHASEWRLTCQTCDVRANWQAKSSCVGAAKNKTRYQNIPSRYQIRASVRHEMTQKSLTVPSFDTVKAHYGAGRGINLGHTYSLP